MEPWNVTEENCTKQVRFISLDESPKQPQYCKRFALSGSFNSWILWIRYGRRFNFFTALCALEYDIRACDEFPKIFSRRLLWPYTYTCCHIVHGRLSTPFLVIYTSSRTKMSKQSWNRLVRDRSTRISTLKRFLHLQHTTELGNNLQFLRSVAPL